MCRGAKGGSRRAGGGRARAARESTFLFPSGASTAAGPLCRHHGPWPCLGSSRAQAAVGGCEGGTGEGGEEETGCPPTAARVPPSQGAGIRPALSAREVAGQALPFANVRREVWESSSSSSSSWGGRLSALQG